MNTGLDVGIVPPYLDENAGRMEYMRAFHPQKAETVSAILRELFRPKFTRTHSPYENFYERRSANDGPNVGLSAGRAATSIRRWNAGQTPPIGAAAPDGAEDHAHARIAAGTATATIQNATSAET